jgi:hypothetical protein
MQRSREWKQWKEEQDRHSLQRRLEVLTLPVVPLLLEGYLSPEGDGRWQRRPHAVGVDATGQALAFWPHIDDAAVGQVTRHTAQGLVDKIEIRHPPVDSHFVQWLPDRRVMLCSYRSGPRQATLWSPEGGDPVRYAPLGRAVHEVLSTISGAIWVAYGDEATGSPGPAGHRLARFSEDLEPDWLYPQAADPNVPVIVDAYALNVTEETAFCHTYPGSHLVQVGGGVPADLGQTGQRGGQAVLIDDDRTAIVFGHSSEYDVLTSLKLNSGTIRGDGRQRRLVLPDGREIHPWNKRIFARGPDLHVFDGAAWYRLALRDATTI